MPIRFPTVLAQANPGENGSSEILLEPGNFILVVMMSMGAFFLVLITWIIFRAMKMSERSRELQHSERVKAIEAGLPWQEPIEPPEKTLGSRFWICFWIMLFGAGIPFSSVPSSLTHMQDVSESIMLAAYISAGFASVTASICVALIMLSKPNETSTNERHPVHKNQT